MNIHEDFEEFLRLLTDEGSEFVVIGGYAVAFHGYVRATQDIDLFFRNTRDNVARIVRALGRFGLPVGEEVLRDLEEPGNIIRLGVPPVRIELLNSISGRSFDQIWESRETGHYGSIPISFISLADLIANKRESGRPKDAADIDELGGHRS
jgi:predicted nucleotidyltransferase